MVLHLQQTPSSHREGMLSQLGVNANEQRPESEMPKSQGQRVSHSIALQICKGIIARAYSPQRNAA